MGVMLNKNLALVAVTHWDRKIQSPNPRWWPSAEADVIEVAEIYHQPRVYVNAIRAECYIAAENYVLIRRSVAEKIAEPCLRCFRSS